MDESYSDDSIYCDYIISVSDAEEKYDISYDGIWNDLYSLYCAVVAINLLIMMIMMCSNHKKWVGVMGYKLIVCEVIIIFGMLLDTIMPMFGIKAFPGSSITQSFGTILMYRVYLFRKKNLIKLENVSEFI